MFDNYGSRTGKIPKSMQGITLEDLIKGKQLDWVAAALLLTGKLKVDSVGLFRDSPAVTVTLLGKFGDETNDDKSNDLVDFLDKNGDMTIDHVFSAFQKRMERNGGK